ARNQQHLLSLESHLGQVADPARGSYTHETLSLKMAEKAWACFQDIEAQGGWRAAKDRFRQEVSEACGAKLARLKSGEDKLIGVNQYARPDIRKAEILPAPKIRHKSGPVIATEDFAQAIAQAQNGHIVPCTPAKTEFERVNFAQMIADGGQT
ncbi:MAG TPA: hypothetical protein ENK01_02695, partial [Hellea balneolensis]|nr:hypothetical protein [Hellea balneolensis]